MITLKEMEKMDKDVEKKKLSEEDKKEIVKKFRDIEFFKNIDDEGVYWSVLILYLVWMQENENERLWKDFREEIKHKSRFFLKVSYWKK